MLTIKNLSVIYGETHVLRDLSLTVGRGEVVCLMGESGCGKSSVLKAILGFADYDGSITVDGHEANAENINVIRKLIAYVPQELSLPANTVEEMAPMPFGLKVNTPKESADELKKALLQEWDKLGVSSKLWDKTPNETSGGQRQRIMLASAALLHKPLIITDEPTSALDDESARLVGEYFRTLAHTHNVAILVVTHSKKFAEFADKTITVYGD